MLPNNKSNGIIYRKSNPNQGAALFPSSSAGDGQISGDATDGMYRCKQCGAENHTHTTQSPGGSAEGDGGVQIGTDENDADDPSVTSGCVFCGSYNSR